MRSFISCIVLLLHGGVILGQECECPASSCPDGWITFRGSCYFIADDVSVDWTEAIHHCQTHNSDLVMIDSVEEDLFLRSILEKMYRTPNQHPGEEFWIGANDEMVEGVWVWYKGDRPLNYTGWYPGQPGTAAEDCALIASRDNKFNGWHDAPCDRQHHPICEISSRQQQIPDIIGRR